MTEFGGRSGNLVTGGANETVLVWMLVRVDVSRIVLYRLEMGLLAKMHASSPAWDRRRKGLGDAEEDR